jgi:hypothetical protein
VISGSPFTVDVPPSAIVVANTRLLNLVTQTEVGVTLDVRLQTADRYGNSRTTDYVNGTADASAPAPGATRLFFDFKLQKCARLTRVRVGCTQAGPFVPGSEGDVPISLRARAQGNIPVPVYTTEPGQYVVTAALNGEAVDGDGLHVTFYPGPADPLKTRTVGRLDDFTAGREAAFEIKTFDRFGNEREEGGEAFDIEIVNERTGVQVAEEIYDHDNSKYTVKFTPTISGDYGLYIKVYDGWVGGAPPVGYVSPATLQVSKCYLYPVYTGDPLNNGLTTALAGTEANFVIQGADRFGNNATLDEGAFDVQLVYENIVDHDPNRLAINGTAGMVAFNNASGSAGAITDPGHAEHWGAWCARGTLATACPAASSCWGAVPWNEAGRAIAQVPRALPRRAHGGVHGGRLRGRGLPRPRREDADLEDVRVRGAPRGARRGVRADGRRRRGAPRPSLRDPHQRRGCSVRR